MESIENNENTNEIKNEIEADFIKPLSEIYQKAICDIVEKNLNYKSNEYEIIYSAGSSKGDNYVGVMYRIQIKDKKDDSIKMSIVAKIPPENTAKREEFQINDCFVREIRFYDEVFPLYRQFQIEKNIDVDKEGFYEAPKCYKTMSENMQEGIFFEDLKARNFEMFDRMKDVTKEHVFLVMKSLAKLHAIFFALNDQKPESVDSFRDIEDSLIVFSKDEKSLLPVWYNIQKNAAADVVKKSKNLELKEKVEKILNTNLFQLLSEVLDKSLVEPYATLCHGDCWNNNMMFQNDENGTPIDVCLYDYQIIRYASPVCDLLYYIFSCTTKELRDKHYQEFLDVYHEKLSGFIKRLGSDPEKLYPRRILDEHLKKFSRLGIVMSIMTLPIFTSAAENTPDMNKISEQFQNEETDIEINFLSTETIGAYEKRMMGVFQDMFDLGYI